MPIQALSLTPWFVLVISGCILCVLIIFLLYCVCWEKHEADIQRLYVIDEDGLKQNVNTLNLKNQEYGISSHFTASDLPLENSTLDCSEILLSNGFDNVVLEIENDDKSTTSCKSITSRNTFYSVWSALTRTFSLIDTSNACEIGDNENLIE